MVILISNMVLAVQFCNYVIRELVTSIICCVFKFSVANDLVKNPKEIKSYPEFFPMNN